MLLTIGFTEIAIIVCSCLAAAMVILSIVASVVSRAAEKKRNKNADAKPAAVAAPVKEQTQPAAPVAEEPKTEEPAAEEPVAEEPVAEEPVAEEPVAEEPAAEEPAAEEPVAEEPAAEETVAEEPVAEEPAAEEPVAEEPVAEDPAAEEPVAEEPAAPVAEVAAVALSTEEKGEAPAPFGNVRYRFGFMAKLIQSGEDVQTRYGELVDLAKSYKKVKVSVSWRQARISSGRNVLAVVMFKGRRLCVAYALDPAEYAESKYGGQNVSEVRRFVKTPYLLKLTSKRKAKYSKELFAAVAEKFGLVQGDVVTTDHNLPYRTMEELVAEGLVKEIKIRQKAAAPQPAAAVVEPVEPEEKEAPAKRPGRQRNRKGANDAPKIKEIEKHEKITAAEAAEIADEAAEKVMEKKGSQINRKDGVKRAIVNVDTLSQNYAAGESVTIESLVEKGLVPSGTNYVKVLARGLIDKPLHVHADDFSMDAVKMIAATGGLATKHVSED